MPNIGFQRFAELKIFNKGFFFPMSFGIFILKKLPTFDTFFKLAETIDPEPKRMEYLIFCAS